MECNPLISIIIPVYNVEKYLKECVDSCINQTYKNLEIILVNDGSTDSSGVLCDDLEKKDNRIKVIHKQNGGLSSARNAGLDVATGNYICFLDSDDWMNVRAIEESLLLSIKYNADIVFWSCIKEFENRSEHYKVCPTTKPIEVFENHQLEMIKRRAVGLINKELSNPTKTDSFISAWGKLYRASLIKENDIQFLPTQEVGSEDVPFNVATFHHANRIVFLNKHYNHYRMFNDNSLTKNHKNTLFPRFKNLYQVLYKFLDENKLPNHYYEALNNRFALTLLNNCLSISSPKYNVSLSTKFMDLKVILTDKDFKKAIKALDISYLPFIWKLFFWTGKRQYFRVCLLMTLFYRKLKYN